MRLNRQILIQLGVFVAIAIAGAAVMLFGYVDLPSRYLGIGQYRVTVNLPVSAGLYVNGNVTYRGTEVGRIESLHLTSDGVAAVLALDSNVAIPSDLDAHVDSQSALGEQYVALLPRNATSPPLRNGDVIARDRTSVPVPIDTLLDTTNRGLQAIPRDQLKTVIDESFTAVGGLGPELSRIVNGSTKLSIDSHANLDPLTQLIDRSPAVLNSQTDTADSISEWASRLATVTKQLHDNDGAVARIISTGGPAADEARALVEHLQPTLPVLLANLVSVDQVGITFQPNIEQMLVLAPLGVAEGQGEVVPNLNVPGSYNAAHSLAVDLNLNLPPPCTTGFLPAQQRLSVSVEDTPERPTGQLYCRIPQDSMFDVRGVRNIPCETKPGKRAPTVKMCESDENYVPLNDGLNWKGDPNATLSGQDIPQLPPGSPPAGAPGTPAPTVIPYDPATGTYVGPDGKVYTQSDLAHGAAKPKTWQSMLTPGGT